jgi:hypothetical protein
MDHEPGQFMAAFLVALRYHVRVSIRTSADAIERRFAEFAGVPYQTPASRQQWQDLWQTEAEP